MQKLLLVNLRTLLLLQNSEIKDKAPSILSAKRGKRQFTSCSLTWDILFHLCDARFYSVEKLT